MYKPLAYGPSKLYLQSFFFNTDSKEKLECLQFIKILGGRMR